MHDVFSNAIIFGTVNHSTGDGFAYGTNIADNTCGQSVASTNTYFVPAAILQNSTVPSAFIAGDSRAIGLFDTATSQPPNYGEIARAMGHLTIPYINTGVASDLAGNTTTYAKRAALAAYTSFVVSDYGTNNINQGNTLPNVISAVQTTYNQLGGLPIYQTTIPPITTTTDSCQTTTNQTLPSYETVRTGFNAAVRGNTFTGMRGAVDIAYEVETNSTGGTNSVLNGGYWKTDGTTQGQYSADCIHETYVGAMKEIPAYPINTFVQ